MKRQESYLIIMLMVLLLIVTSGHGEKIVLSADGESTYTVVYNSNATAAEINAVKELAEHLKKVSGATLPEKVEDKKTNGPAIYIGATDYAKLQGISFDDFEPEEWLIKVVGKNVIIGGGRPRGTLYGVWEFLEKYAGVMWLDQTFTYFPRINKFVIPANLELKGKPVFAIRGIFAYFNDREKRVQFMARNRQNLFHDEMVPSKLAEPWGVTSVYGSPRACHTFCFYTKDWPAKYDNCFSLSADGKRLRATGPMGPGQVCFSNPQTRKLFADRLRKYIKADRKRWPVGFPLVYDVSMNDNHDKCECQKCLELAKKYDSYGGVTLEFINAIADEIVKDYPNVQVQTLAYFFSTKAPKHIKASPNVLIRLAELEADMLRPLTHPNNAEPLKHMRDWSRISQLAIWDYWTAYGRSVGPATNIEATPVNLRLYRKNGVKSIFAECENPIKNSFYSLRLWLGYKLMQNPDQEADVLIDKFMNAYYGEQAAPFMRQYLNYLEARMLEVKESLGKIRVSRQGSLDNDFFTRSEELLTAAEKEAADDEKILSRIAKERIAVDLARLERLEHLKPGLKTDYRKLIDRYKRNSFAAIESFIAPAKRERCRQKVQKECQKYEIKLFLSGRN